jgi:hypothetical protein
MRKVGIWGLVLVLCLAVVGIGYATWEKNLEIDGTVGTGILDAQWEEVMAWDTDDDVPGKDVSDIMCEADPADPQILILTVTNAYPCIDYYNMVDIVNTGTIPLDVIEIVLNNPSSAYLTVELLDENLEPLELPAQVEPDEALTVVIHLHLEQAAPQGESMTLSATVFTAQWNWENLD